MTEPAEGQAREPADDEAGPSLETRLKRLDEIVSALEADGVPLDRALALFEEGVGHLRRAERMLTEAELKVEELIGRGDHLQTRPFHGDGE